MSEDMSARRQPPKEELHLLAYFLYYIMLFFAYWFGASRFDVDGDGDFDPEDVEKYLQDQGYLRRNFTQTKTAKRRIKKAKSSTMSTSGRQDGDGVSSKPSTSSLDRNQDGRVDMDDMITTAVDGVAEEDEIRQNLIEKQILPWFVIFECVSCFCLWIGWALTTSIREGGDPLTYKAGIDSFAEGMTDLRLSSENCDDYRFEVWRWFAYQWTHVGALHVLMNVFLTVMLGVPLEGLHGHFRMALMFNVGVFGGALCYFVNDAHTAVVGCSGGCYALIGMHVADLLMNWHQKKFRVPTVLFLVIMIGIDVFSYIMSISSEASSHSAHVGGGIAGLLIGVVIGKNLVVKTCERVLSVCAFALGGLLVAFCLVWLVLHSAPLNIWESMNGENGYCWIRQVYNATIAPTTWLCVRCGTPECMAHWQPQRATLVRSSACDAIGYYFDGR